MKVEEIMTKNLEYIDPDAVVYEAIGKMIERRIRSLIVRPRDEKDTYGVITLKDIVFKAIGKGLDLNEVKVEKIATKPVISINKDMEIGQVVKLMEEFKIARVFVSEGKEIIGIVALFDVIAGAIKEKLGVKKVYS